MTTSTTLPAPPEDQIQFEARLLADSKVGFRVPCANLLDASHESSVLWVRDFLLKLKADDAPERLTLRKIGPGPTGGLQVRPLDGSEDQRKGDLVLEGMDCMHEGQPGDGHWYITLKVKSASTYKGEKGEEDLGDGEVANDTERAPPTVNELLAALADGRILAFSKSTPRGVAITFRDAHNNEKSENITIHARPDTESPPREPPPPVVPPLGRRVPGTRRPMPAALAPPAKPEEVSENSLRSTLVKILTEEYERAEPTSAKPGDPVSFRERVFARVLALVDPVSQSPAQAHVKAEWFVRECMKVFDRKRMDRQDIVDLVASIATGKGMRG